MASTLRDVLVCYDVETSTAAGRRRLRRVGNVCLGFGNRVQDSVFECRVTATSYGRLIRRISAVMDTSKDSVRIYELTGPRSRYLHVLGVDLGFDLDKPLVFGANPAD